MPLYRKKPIAVEAMQLPAENDDAPPELVEWLGLMTPKQEFFSGRDGELEIETTSGLQVAQPLDWIIRGVDGEYYPCPKAVFEASYEKA